MPRSRGRNMFHMLEYSKEARVAFGVWTLVVGWWDGGVGWIL